MNTKELLDRTLIAIDAYSKRNQRTKKDNKTILIVFQQVFGDSVLNQPALEEYTKLYPKEKGYTVRFLVRPSVLSFMKQVLPLPKDMIFEEVDFKRYLSDYSYYKVITDKYHDQASTIIIPGNSLSGLIFSTSCNAKRKIGVGRGFPTKKPFAMAMFYKVAYTEMVPSTKKEMVLLIQEHLINYLGNKEYKGHLPTLLKKDKIINEDKYCVICPGSSEKAKCWPIDRFKDVADYVIEKYDMNIHLCGGSDEKAYGEELKRISNYPERIISHIGETSFSDWSAIIQHASLVIGNDSATLHMAAASKRKACCINGVYEENVVYPYYTGVESEKTHLPAYIYKHLDCAWCREKNYWYGSSNKECAKRIKENKCATCIDLIKTNEVKDIIDKLMEKNNEIFK